MKSQIEMSKAYQVKFENYLANHKVVSDIVPTRFIEIMKTHKGIVDFFEMDNDDYIELRNPLIAVLGDSVSGGHFETINLQKLMFAQDLADSYVEKFKYLLHDLYDYTTPSIINSGIAGDNIKGMDKRLVRDVISHDPDLVIINATLNWSKHRGTLVDFQAYYEDVIQKIQHQTHADIILLTPNGAISSEKDQNLNERVNIVRLLAHKYHTSLVDIYRMWTDVVGDGDVRETLSNRENHPTPLGHTYMAQAILQLFE